MRSRRLLIHNTVIMLTGRMFERVSFDETFFGFVQDCILYLTPGRMVCEGKTKRAEKLKSTVDQ